MQGKVELCSVNTSKLPLLKNAEMRELIASRNQATVPHATSS